MRAWGVTATRAFLYKSRMLRNPRLAPAAFLPLSLAVIGFVLFSQYVQGYQPCELCLRERWPWYIIVGLSAVGLAYPSRWIVLAIGVALLVGAGFGLHHVGVEQRWWPGPDACASTAQGAKTVEQLRAMLLAEPVVRCDEITWTFIGLSMTSYNFLLSLVSSLIALLIARRLPDERHVA
jgi:disulfide bond formation protein DsbB